MSFQSIVRTLAVAIYLKIKEDSCLQKKIFLLLWIFIRKFGRISPVITNKAQKEHNNRDLWPWAPYASVDVSARFADRLLCYASVDDDRVIKLVFISYS
jgi:hypothetical protein